MTPTAQKGKHLFDIVLPAVEKAVGSLEDLYADLPVESGRPISGATSNHPAGRLVDLLGKAESLTNGMSKAMLPVQGPARTAGFTDARSEMAAQVQASTACASNLRGKLAEFACLAPVEDTGSGEDAVDDPCPSDFRTLQKLAHWRNLVSCKEMLSRKESVDILRVLLRAERAIAELQRGEAACTRRWDALSQEVRQASDRIKAIRGRAQKLKERRCDVDTAAGCRRKELWAKLLQAAEPSEGHTAAMAAEVHQQLCETDGQRQQLRECISADREKLHRVGSKRRQAQDTLELLTQLARQQDNKADLSERHSVDDVVDAELDLEAVLWQQIREERMSFPGVSSSPPPPLPPEVNSPDDLEQASESPSFAPCPPTHAELDDTDLDGRAREEDPGVPSLPTQSREAEDAALHVEPKKMPSSVPQKVASLIERLSMSRDERRRAERRPKASVPEGLAGKPLQVNRLDSRPSEADSFGLARPGEPLPPLPEPDLLEAQQQGTPQMQPMLPSHPSPELLWGELPSAPLDLHLSDPIVQDAPLPGLELSSTKHIHGPTCAAHGTLSTCGMR